MDALKTTTATHGPTHPTQKAMKANGMVKSLKPGRVICGLGLLALTAGGVVAQGAAGPPYLNASLPIEQRVDDLLRPA